jgi:hypothetical protein
MPTYEVKSMINDQPSYEKPIPEILAEVKWMLLAGKHRGVFEFGNKSQAEYISDKQRKWYKGICLPWLAKHDDNRESTYWWDDEVKRLCSGLALLKPDIFFMQGVDGRKIPIGRLTTSGVGKRNMTQFIEEILAKSVEKGWGVAPPDSDLRSKK